MGCFCLLQYNCVIALGWWCHGKRSHHRRRPCAVWRDIIRSRHGSERSRCDSCVCFCCAWWAGCSHYESLILTDIFVRFISGVPKGILASISSSNAHRWNMKRAMFATDSTASFTRRELTEAAALRNFIYPIVTLMSWVRWAKQNYTMHPLH